MEYRAPDVVIEMPKDSGDSAARRQRRDRLGNDHDRGYEPDASQTIYWGDQNWDEMQNCFVGVLIDPTADPAKLFTPSGPSLLPRGASAPTLSALK
jgi:hypothetical protein